MIELLSPEQQRAAQDLMMSRTMDLLVGLAQGESPLDWTRAEVEAWMDAVGETDTVTRNEVLANYGFDPDFRYPDSGRRTCRQCRNLSADGGCRAARRGQIPRASRHYTWPNGIDDPHRCVWFREATQ